MSVLGGSVWGVVAALAMVAILLKCLAVLSARASEKTLRGEDSVESDPALSGQVASVSAPRVVADPSMESGQVATWDCVWFGSYPQTEVTHSDPVYASLESASWDASGDATVGGARYRRIAKSDATYDFYWFIDGYRSDAYRYFRYEPIKWRVLEVNGGTALVVADVALNDQPYNTNHFVDVTWETCSVRSWLNGYGTGSNQPETDYTSRSFVGTAFSPAELGAVLPTAVRNADNSYCGTPGGSDTSDRVFLLSESEAYDTGHGFATSCDTRDEARRCRPSDYAYAMGAYRDSDGSYDGNCWWWLRSPGDDADNACGVYYDGSVDRHGGSLTLYGPFATFTHYAVRPALNLDLSSSSIRPAGTVSSDGTMDETAPTGTGGQDVLVPGTVSHGHLVNGALDLSEQSASVSAPRLVANSSMESGQVTTWDCVWFGSYPQTEVVPWGPVYSSLEAASWDASGDATVGGARYRRIAKSDTTSNYYWSNDGYDFATWRYFRWEPIKWRVLSVSGTSALVVADVALDDQRYNSNDIVEVIWETCSLRSWLNGYGAGSSQPGIDYASRGFVATAFSPAELGAILETTFVNADNTHWGALGGSDTSDHVFLLSESEAYDAGHGFASSCDTKDEARRCRPSGYARAMGASRTTFSGYVGNCPWWLRSPGYDAHRACRVGYDGYVDQYGNRVDDTHLAVRPALSLDLSSPHVRYAGTVSSDGSVDETAPTNPSTS